MSSTLLILVFQWFIPQLHKVVRLNLCLPLCVWVGGGVRAHVCLRLCACLISFKFFDCPINCLPAWGTTQSQIVCHDDDDDDDVKIWLKKE